VDILFRIQGENTGQDHLKLYLDEQIDTGLFNPYNLDEKKMLYTLAEQNISAFALGLLP